MTKDFKKALKKEPTTVKANDDKETLKGQQQFIDNNMNIGDVKPITNTNTTSKRPGRPKVKTEPTKTINIAIPLSVLEKIDIALVKYQGNLTQYVNAVIKKDLENNFDDYKKLHDLMNQ